MMNSNATALGIDDKIDAFINKLSNIDNMDLCFNPYNSDDACADATRIANLRNYLKKMHIVQPNVIIIGEAPGHRGCHWTGTPFSSEKLITEDHFFYGSSQGFKVVEQVTKQERPPVAESTATIMWKFISDHEHLRNKPPLFWNSFPLHPHAKDSVLSNRPPKDGEVIELSWALKDMMDMFNVDTVIALGRKAEKLLKTDPTILNGKTFTYVRHPSQGGKTLCEKGLTKILNGVEEDNIEEDIEKETVKEEITYKSPRKRRRISGKILYQDQVSQDT
ncbi:Gag-Pol polyprotein [Acrasis kona]|uniref:Gag-Pol polyprotein n=1 Tax=Acrasis kona TaxID=1008807 RepID=A0AAW2Z652_9EUKA